jgi:tetratricopeptide (TPR) repeat protein
MAAKKGARKKLAPIDRHVREGDRLNKNGAVITHRMGESMAPRMLFEEAIKSFEKALSINPQHFRALKGKAFAHFHLREYKLAAKTYKRALKYGEDIETHYFLGKTLLKLKDHQEALKHFMWVVKEDKDNAPAKYNMAVALMKYKRPRYDKISNHLDRLLKTLPEEEPQLKDNEAPYLGEGNLEVKVSNLKIWVDFRRKGKKAKDASAWLLRKFKRRQ